MELICLKERIIFYCLKYICKFFWNKIIKFKGKCVIFIICYFDMIVFVFFYVYLWGDFECFLFRIKRFVWVMENGKKIMLRVCVFFFLLFLFRWYCKKYLLIFVSDFVFVKESILDIYVKFFVVKFFYIFDEGYLRWICKC